MRTVIARAEATQHPALASLRQALAQGKAEDALRRRGVIHEGDINREFPLAK